MVPIKAKTRASPWQDLPPNPRRRRRLERFEEGVADARALASSSYAEYDPTVLLDGVAALAATGQLEEAIELVKRYVERAPNDEEGWTILAELYRVSGNGTKQAESEENLRLLVRNGAIGAHENALRVELNGDRDAAIALLKNALEIDPSYSPAAEELKRLGGSYQATGSWRLDDPRISLDLDRGLEIGGAGGQGSCPEASARCALGIFLLPMCDFRATDQSQHLHSQFVVP